VLLVKEITNFLETKFPLSLACKWDNVGLQVGDYNREVKRVMVALDATIPVIAKAIERQVDLLITHHPLIFSPITAIDFSTTQGQKLQQLIQHEITLYAMHTNYDLAPRGMNDLLANALGLLEIKPLINRDDLDGLGRLGNLEKALPFSNLVALIKAKKLSGDGDVIKTVEANGANLIKKVAVIGGSGGKYFADAKAAGADVLVTGDVTYHLAIDAKEMGLSLIDIGHFAEIIMERAVATLLRGAFATDLLVLTSAGVSPISYH